MKALILNASEDTPEIIFNPGENVFKVSKISVPENALEFYETVLDWLKEYLQSPNKQNVFEFDLEYVNTASSKQLIQVILSIQKLSEVSDTSIKWYYESIDEDMFALGRRFQKLVNVNFELIEV